MFSVYILLTNSEVCSRKYSSEVFVQSEVCAEKTEGKYFPVQIEKNEVDKEFIVWILLSFLIAFNIFFVL